MGRLTEGQLKAIGGHDESAGSTIRGMATELQVISHGGPVLASVVSTRSSRIQ
jgi:hypothetical protein